MSKELDLINKNSRSEHSFLVKEFLLKVKSGFDILQDIYLLTNEYNLGVYLNNVCSFLCGVDVYVGGLHSIFLSAKTNLTQDDYDGLCQDTYEFINWLRVNRNKVG